MKWLGLIAVLVVVTIVILASKGQLPAEIKALYDFPGGDKVGHILLMGTLSFFVNLAVVSTLVARPTRKIVITTAILGLAITLEEITQQFFSTRTFSLLDLLASFLGLTIAAVIVNFIAGKKQS
ncbi:VanZ family protein [Endozoicomonas sp. SM1973]|uniref:VanZ family protein n=1 Tax=Spartinivicinus marinus TaxID=2994442 RepID=A0A853IC97_9GAMM|nr:VanZ family protein [Spartinivicinus marinus]MCX4026453.1 VanZ family protein [Spartinivicinus marinus]NYZ66825.1 VanZ family protein [Spartinivicinus marinus]